MTTRAFILLLLFAPSVPAIAQSSSSGARAPIIALSRPSLGKDSVVVVKEPFIELAGRIVAPAEVKYVLIGNATTGARVNGVLRERGDFTAKVPLSAGENKLMVMVEDADQGSARMGFRVKYEAAAEAKAPVEEKAEPVQATPGEHTEAPRPRTEYTMDPVRPRPDKEGVYSREEVMGGKEAVPSSRTGTVHAVVVGISRYENDAALELRYAVSDARAFGDHVLSPTGLAAPRANVALLMNGEASAEAIRYALRQAAAKAGPDDLLVFYFAGHGINDGAGRLCLLTYDVSTGNEQRMWATGLTQSALADALSSSRCRQRVLILDACDSGLMTESNGGVDARTLATSDASLRILTATSRGESAHESARLDGGHGVFSHCLLRGLRGEADGLAGSAKDGTITLQEVSVYVKDQVNKVARDLDGGPQNPVCHCAQDNEVVLGRTTPRAVPTERGDTRPMVVPVAETAEVKTVDYASVPIPVDKTEINGMVYADEETGEKVRFFNSNATWSDLSGFVARETFHGRAVLKGKTFSMDDRDAQERLRKWTYEMNPEWTELRVHFTLPDGTGPAPRVLRRIGVPKREELVEGTIFLDPVQDQRLEVVEQHGSWMRLSGNIGSRIVDLVAHAHGDVYDLEDNNQDFKASGRLLMSDHWNGMSGNLTFNEDKVAPFVLRLEAPVSDHALNGATYRDMTYNSQEITFYNEHPGSVSFNGRLGPGNVDIVCYKHGDVLLCADQSGAMEPFRLLMKNDRRKLTGTITAKTTKEILQVNMMRVAGAATK